MMDETSVYQVFALKYAGPATSSGAFLLWMREWEKTAERGYFFWLLKNSSRSILVDAGVAPELARERALPGYRSPAEALSCLGEDAAKAGRVILTHLHWDHAGALGLFPEARFYVQKSEYDFWVNDPVSQRPPFALLRDSPSLSRLADLRAKGRVELLEGDGKIAPGVKCIFAPGHSPGMQAVVVQTEKGRAVLGSDCGHMFRNYQEDWPSSIVSDMPALMRTYDRLRAEADDPGLIFPGHDPLMQTAYPRVAPGVTRLA